MRDDRLVLVVKQRPRSAFHPSRCIGAQVGLIRRGVREFCGGCHTHPIGVDKQSPYKIGRALIYEKRFTGMGSRSGGVPGCSALRSPRTLQYTLPCTLPRLHEVIGPYIRGATNRPGIFGNFPPLSGLQRLA